MYTGNRGRTAFFDTAAPSQNYSSLTLLIPKLSI